MLYKHYRYLIIAKIILLIAGGFMLFSQWKSISYTTGGTSIVVSSGSQKIDANGIIGVINTTSGPYSLIYRDEDMQKNTLHIPWTYDTGYILQYLRNGFPVVNTELTDNSYLKECMLTIHVYGQEIHVTQCQKYGLHGQIIAIVFIIVGILL